ncbi:phosphatidylinositol 3-kinase [Violaceomyces palustris]|uniref:Phosphatidylinositol 3-kinase n=1 Tax=Violaceomyces palustris TaxID=1673888 RepID=A0ACD0NW09_9BASI|nr:phosphatidylinositol 3-kinase [Violaceomyces palustris]
MDKDFYSFARLTDLNLDLTFRISSLQGRLERKTRSQLLEQPQARHWGVHQSNYPDLYVSCRLYSDNKPLTVPYRTAYKAFKHNHQWSEWITLPYKLCDLPLNAQLAFTVYDVAGSSSANVIGGSTFRLFSKKGTLKNAQHRLFLWKGLEGDGSAETGTPSKVGDVQDEMGRLEKLIKRHERGDLPRIDWLDKLAYRQIEKVHKMESENSDDLFLYIDMPRFDLPIVFCEQEGPLPSSSPSSTPSMGPYSTLGPVTAANTSATGTSSSTPTPSTLAAANNVSQNGQQGQSASTIEASLFTIVDPEVFRENPVEAKHRRLVRSHRSGPLDRELKPNAAVRDELNEILSYPPTRVLTTAEMDRIWSFRFYLTRDPKGLTKFLKSVVWSDPGEAKQATEVLLPMWTEPALDDALELLGPTFRDPRVRAYAVRQLERAGDELVQALKFDELATQSNSGNVGHDGTISGHGRDRRNLLASRHLGLASSSAASTALEDSGLTDFLIRRSLRNPVLGNNFYWYLVVECEDKSLGKLFRRIKQKYLDRMSEVENGNELRNLFRRQGELINTLSQKAKELRSSRDPRPKKIDKLRAIISDSKHGLQRFDPPIPLPIDAEVRVTGIVAEKSTVFKSNLFPLRLQFTRAPNRVAPGPGVTRSGSSNIVSSVADLGLELDAHGDQPEESMSGDDQGQPTYALIFKNGDDLRQDQLVIQLFTLMDRLLRNENLDLKITPYKVLATGSVDGMVQFVESMSIAAIMGEYGGSLLNYLRHHHSDPSSPSSYHVKASVFDTFIRSCVDFGYILGRDPKPFPPPVKVCKEMVDAMGGTSSPHYGRFKSLCYTAFTSLRKSANLILNLVALMVDANVPDIKVEPDKAVLKVQDKFMLELSEDEAIKHFEALLNETSYLSTMFDRLHDMAQYFRQ